MREKSRTFSISDESRRHSCTMKRKYSPCFCSPEILPRSKLSAINRTDAMGARSSCETLETKLDFISLSCCCRLKTRQAVSNPIKAAMAETAMSEPNQNVRVALIVKEGRRTGKIDVDLQQFCSSFRFSG